MLVYTYTEHYIIPLTPTADQPLFRTIIELILPFMVCTMPCGEPYLRMPTLYTIQLCYLLLFYIIFGG